MLVEDLTGASDTATITINLSDVNEFPVGPISDTNPAADQVTENAVAGTNVGITALATDGDGTATVGYSLDDDAGSRFAIDAVSGVVTTTQALDFESAASYSIIVRATSSDGSFRIQSLAIAVLDQNDNPPVIPAGQTFATPENRTNGAAIGTAIATDADTVGTLQNWTIVGGTGASAFSINSATGQITVADSSQLDFETTTSFTLQVTVSDGANTSAIQTLTIDLTNVDEPPTLDLDSDNSSGQAGAITQPPLPRMAARWRSSIAMRR